MRAAPGGRTGPWGVSLPSSPSPRPAWRSRVRRLGATRSPPATSTRARTRSSRSTSTTTAATGSRSSGCTRERSRRAAGRRGVHAADARRRARGAGDGDRPVVRRRHPAAARRHAADRRPHRAGAAAVAERARRARAPRRGRDPRCAGRPAYYDYDGEPLDHRRLRRRMIEQVERRPATTITAVYRVEDADALDRVLGKLREQGLETQPLEGVEGARRLGEGVAVLGGDTLVAVLADDERPGRPAAARAARGRRGRPRGARARRGFHRRARHARAARRLAGPRGTATRAREHRGPGAARREAAAQARRGGRAGDARVDFDGLAAEELPLPGRVRSRFPPARAWPAHPPIRA